MAQSVKMVYVVDDVEKNVGRCHPGQARLLQKAGVAEFRDGKLYLKDAPRNSNLVASKADEGWTSESYQKRWIPPEDFDDIEAIQRELWGDSLWVSPSYTRIDCSTFAQWMLEIEVRRAAGHELHPYDDPRNRLLGFLDYTDMREVYVGLTAVAEARADMDPAVKACLRTPAGRHKLIDPNWTPDDTLPGELPDDLFGIPGMDDVRHLNATVAQDEDGSLRVSGITNPEFVAGLRTTSVAMRAPEGWTRARGATEIAAPLFYSDGKPFQFNHTSLYRRKGDRLVVVRSLNNEFEFEVYRAFMDPETLQYTIKDVLTVRKPDPDDLIAEGTESVTHRDRAFGLALAFLDGKEQQEGNSLNMTLDEYVEETVAEITKDLVALSDAMKPKRKAQIAE